VNRRFKLFVVLMCLFGNPCTANGQIRDITLRQYASSQGLSQNTVTALYLDSQGLLWAGTCNGMNLLQGTELVRVDRQRAHNPILDDNTIRSIGGAGTARLLIGTEGGAYVYDLQGKTFRRQHVPELKLRDQMVKPFQVGKFLCYVSREDKLMMIDTTTGEARIVKYNHLEGKQSFAVYKTSAYWLSANPHKLFRMNGLTGEIRSFLLPDRPGREEPGYVSLTSDNEVLITYAKGFLILNPTKGSQQYISLERPGLPCNAPRSRAIFAVRAPDQSVWIGIHGHGVCQVSQCFSVISSYTDVYENFGDGLFNLRTPVCCVIDRSGNVFVGTDGHGIIKINPSIRKFRHIIPPFQKTKEISDQFVTAIYKDSTGVLFYACLNSGLMLCRHDDRILKQILHVEGQADRFRRVHFIVPWRKGQLLVGTDQGLTIYAGGKRLIPFRQEKSPMIFTLCCGLEDGRYVLGGKDGLFMLKDSKITKINTGNVNQITLLKYLGNNTLLLAERHDQLYRLVMRQDGVSLSVIHNPNREKQTKAIYFQAVETPDALFVATSFGLLVFDHDLTLKRRVTLADGLPDQCIYTLEADRNGMIWMGTNSGLGMLNTTDWTIHNFTRKDGLQSMEFNAGASFFASDGEMFFGGVNGMNAFFPDRYKPNTNPPKILLTGISIHDQKMNPDSLLCMSDVRFPYNHNNFTFTLIANEYTIPERNQIRVKLKGLDQHWVTHPGGSSARYPFLPPGRYALMASGSNNDGLWTSPETLFIFTIEKPFWQRGWFLMLMMTSLAGLLVLGVYLYYRTQHRRRMMEIRQHQAVEAVRSRIAGEMHDDIGAGLTRIALLTEQLVHEPVMQSEHLPILEKMGRLSSTAHELIQSLGEIVWMTNPAKDSLESMLVFIRKTLNAMTEDSGFEPTCDFPSDIPKLEIMPETRRRLSLIIKECINNAVKHSGGDTITITFSLFATENFELSVSDNGTGFPTSLEGDGNGIRNIRQHADAINLLLQIHSRQPAGTRVILSGSLHLLSAGAPFTNQNASHSL
jgi:signal transduction histidine kinase